jgi:hypothetical protein
MQRVVVLAVALLGANALGSFEPLHQFGEGWPTTDLRRPNRQREAQRLPR